MAIVSANEAGGKGLVGQGEAVGRGGGTGGDQGGGEGKGRGWGLHHTSMFMNHGS